MAGGFGEHGIAYLEACIAALPSSASLLLAQLGTALADLCYAHGRNTRAVMLANEAVRSARGAGNGPVLAEALRSYAGGCIDNDIAAADAALTEAEAIPGVSPILATNLLIWRSRLSMSTGDLDTAARTFVRLRDQFRSLGSRRNEVMSISDLAKVEFLRQQYRDAGDLWREAIAIIRGENQPAVLCVLLCSLGSTLALCGDVEAATGAAIESLAIGARAGPEHAAPAIELCAYIAALQGDVERAAPLAGYATACFARIGSVRDHVDATIHNRLTALMNEHLAPDILARLTAEGATLSAEAAVARARE
jgi:tetratricopeptide (TPR) repeat protein